MDYFDHLELRVGQDVLWVARSVAVPASVRLHRVRPGDPRMSRILSLREDPVALRRFCGRSLSHLQVGRLTDVQLASAVEADLESGRLCALVFTLGDAHVAQGRVETAQRTLPPMPPPIKQNAAMQRVVHPAAVGVAKHVVAPRVVAPTVSGVARGPAALQAIGANPVVQPPVIDDPDAGLRERFIIVVDKAWEKSPENARKELERLKSPETIGGVLATFAILMIAYGFGVGQAATATLLAFAYVMGGWAAVIGITHIIKFVVLFYNAKTEDDLDEAADVLSKAVIAVVEIGLSVLLRRVASSISWPNKPPKAQRRSAPANPKP